jgi:hypothetical protein
MNAILFETKHKDKIAVVVENYSKENVLNALSKNLGVDINNIEQLSASMSYGIYAIKMGMFTGESVQSRTYMDTKYQLTFNVEYIIVIN